MRRLPTIIGACMAALVVAACDSAHTQTATATTTRTAPSPLATIGPTPRCAPGNVTMNCVLAKLPPPPKTYRLAPGEQYGVDFGWSAVSAARAKTMGARFGASYFSADASKNWTRALVDSYHAAGLKTVGVWETSATRAQDGRAAGIADAHAAAAQAAAVGNATRPILFAVDCDCAGASILGYFQGVHHVLGARADAYGGRAQVLYLYQHHLVGHENWQTYAWSGGAWLPGSIAPLEQYLNGSSYDNDRAVATPYGQWPWQAPKPKPPSRTSSAQHYARYPNVAWRIDRQRMRERSTVRTWDRANCMLPARRTVCKTTRAHLQLLAGRLWHVAHHPLRHGKPTWGVDYRGGRYQGLAGRLSTAQHGVVLAWR